jgi:rhamnose transport system ATP-binding protein
VSEAATAEALVSVRSVSKHFRGQFALEDIDVDIFPASIHALVGENGAGKSTLGRIVAGLLQPTGGVVQVDGSPVRYKSPADALDDGITMIAQEIALAGDLTVMENVVLGFEKSRAGILSRRSMRLKFDDLLNRTGFDVAGNMRVSELPISTQQEVEILRALARNARLIVMDEPTAALSAADGARLRENVRRLRDEGVAIVYVSHFLDDVMELADEITVMRNGRVVETIPSAEASIDRLILGMLGKRLDAVFPEKVPAAPDAPTVLQVRGVRTRPQRDAVDLELKGGEILGIFGLMGAGRSSLAHTIAGSFKMPSGTVELEGKGFSPRKPGDAIEDGLVLLPESRRDQGLFLSLSQLANTSAASMDQYTVAGVTRTRALRRDVRSMLESVKVEPIRLGREVGELSGGNQQKVLFAKCLLRRPRVLILDEPTRGVDIGSKQGIYGLIAELAARGTGILLISSELEEVTQLAHRVLVMRNGSVEREFGTDRLDPDDILAAAFGFDAAGTANQKGQQR